MQDNEIAKSALAKLVIDFTEAFNREDIDEVMSYFAVEALYDEFNGDLHLGKSAIREAFVPQFRGDFGKMRFHTEDMFLEVGPGEKTGKAIIRWLLTLEDEDRSGGWRGLDILHFEDGQLKEKLTYAKTKAPLIRNKFDCEDVQKAVDAHNV